MYIINIIKSSLSSNDVLTRQTIIFQTLKRKKQSNPSNLRQVAQSISFSSDKLPQNLSRFSVKENSAEAKIIQHTIQECEKPSIEGEDKYCERSEGAEMIAEKSVVCHQLNYPYSVAVCHLHSKDQDL